MPVALVAWENLVREACCGENVFLDIMNGLKAILSLSFCLRYVRDILLNPPAYEIASTIQAMCKLMSNVTCSIPEFTCVSSAKLVKLLELREANHIEFCRIKNVVDEIVHMNRNSELGEILELLMDPTWVATGLKIDFETLVTEDFLPIISRIKATTAPLGGTKGEILYAREHEAVWFKGKWFMPSVWAGTPGEEQIRHLKPAIDSKGRKVGEEWFTTAKVEDALTRYHEAGAKAKAKVLELLRGLSSELQAKVNILVFASTLLIIAKALFAHVRLETNNFIYLFSITSQICTEFDVVFHVKLLV
ncbi:DNA mismatch repair protein MSH1, mitochondrial-like isoform X2 [Ziziphus jujuba]|uniref:DNA mismatch repair protein MSH1, mitochondrial-like isoform X2 n=1 Tax=Ziziphus jujuba TaxID=326968 RepID=A0ABM4A450_ZIZJJ|nr:DNA mismatch repair protein MSH1, mitochondrial-like isoform X2 [Ziziphus jujuba]